MNKLDLVDMVAKKHDDVPLKSVKEAVAAIFEAISRALVRNCRVEIRGFGSFTTKTRDAWIANDPRTGKQNSIPKRRVPTFKAGGHLRKRMNKGRKKKR
jgi:integration host factor subunit beta